MTVDVADVEPIDEATEALVYRAAQEGVRNVVRHADATAVVLTVARRGAGELVLTVRDNGRGLTGRRRPPAGGAVSDWTCSASSSTRTAAGSRRPTPRTAAAARRRPPRRDPAGRRTGGDTAPRGRGAADDGVLLVDDHAVVRHGLANLLTAAGIEVVGSLDDGVHAEEAVRELEPDLVLMDLSMPGMDGIEATRAVLEAARPRPR